MTVKPAKFWHALLFSATFCVLWCHCHMSERCMSRCGCSGHMMKDGKWMKEKMEHMKHMNKMMQAPGGGMQDDEGEN